MLKRVGFMTLAAVLVLSLLLISGCSGGSIPGQSATVASLTPPSPRGSTGTISVRKTVEAASLKIPTEGGAISVTDSASALNGLELTVPGGSYSQRLGQNLIGNIDNVKISLFGYRYPQIAPHTLYGNIAIASLPDLAAMKLDTIIGRGTKRDFIDIYFLTQRFTLETLFSFYQSKYANVEKRALMLKKSLVYFADIV